jgi:hypothetical protein
MRQGVYMRRFLEGDRDDSEYVQETEIEDSIGSRYD